MSHVAYYNEHDPKAAAWLRELIKAGQISPGEVDERSIVDVAPTELAGFTQCHFFAGIGVWSYALRRAGWSDDRPVWTGSCPCQPFSAAGKGEGVDDSRHLWPIWFRLIAECRPVAIFGEQVRDAIRHGWLDLVCADLEGANYRVGAAVMGAHSVGAPHIRQRLYFVADTSSARRRSERPNSDDNDSVEAILGGQEESGRCGAVRRLADASRGGQRVDGGASGRTGHVDERGTVGGMAYSEGVGRANGETLDRSGRSFSESTAEIKRTRNRGAFSDVADAVGARLEGQRQGFTAEGRWDGTARPTAESLEPGRLADDDGREQQRREGLPDDGNASRRDDVNGRGQDGRPGPVNGFWRDADWLYCRDGKWRPVRPGSFPLAHGASARVGRLRGYGNAIVAPLAEAFVRAYLDVLGAIPK